MTTSTVEPPAYIIGSKVDPKIDPPSALPNPQYNGRKIVKIWHEKNMKIVEYGVQFTTRGRLSKKTKKFPNITAGNIEKKMKKEAPKTNPLKCKTGRRDTVTRTDKIDPVLLKEVKTKQTGNFSTNINSVASDKKLTDQFEKSEVLNLLKTPDSGKPHKIEVEHKKLNFSLDKVTKNKIRGQTNIQSYLKKKDAKTGKEEVIRTRQEKRPECGLEKEITERILSPRKLISCEGGILPGVYDVENTVSKLVIEGAAQLACQCLCFDNNPCTAQELRGLICLPIGFERSGQVTGGPARIGGTKSDPIDVGPIGTGIGSDREDG